MKRKRVYISIFLFILAAACVYLIFDNSRLRYNGFSTTPNGISPELATHTDVFLYPVKIGSQYGYIDQRGDVVISP